MIGLAIKYSQAQFKKLSDKLSDFERGRVVHQSTQDVAEFMQDKLRRYPAQKHVTRAQAFGQTFQSDKQRRWFFAALGSGELTLPYQRTNALAQGWDVRPLGSDGVQLINETPYAGYVMERSKQSRMAKLIGWQTVSYWLQRYGSEIGRVALKNIRRWKDS